MGQYYMPLLMGKDKQAFRFYSHDYSNGLKLMEHSWVGNCFVNAVLSKLDDTPMRVAWMGDYADSDERTEFSNGFIKSHNSFMYYYRKAWGDKSRVPAIRDAEQYPLNQDTTDCYLVNLTQNCYIDMQQYIQENNYDGWIINPLPLLTCIGNGGGGGDYFSDVGQDDVGTWAFDEIYVTGNKPVDMTEKHYNFKEDWQ